MGGLGAGLQRTAYGYFPCARLSNLPFDASEESVAHWLVRLRLLLAGAHGPGTLRNLCSPLCWAPCTCQAMPCAVRWQLGRRTDTGLVSQHTELSLPCCHGAAAAPTHVPLTIKLLLWLRCQAMARAHSTGMHAQCRRLALARPLCGGSPALRERLCDMSRGAPAPAASPASTAVRPGSALDARPREVASPLLGSTGYSTHAQGCWHARTGWGGAARHRHPAAPQPPRKRGDGGAHGADAAGDRAEPQPAAHGPQRRGRGPGEQDGARGPLARRPPQRAHAPSGWASCASRGASRHGSRGAAREYTALARHPCLGCRHPGRCVGRAMALRSGGAASPPVGQPPAGPAWTAVGSRCTLCEQRARTSLSRGCFDGRGARDRPG